MANILCIETATEVCSVSVSQSGKLLGYTENLSSYKHSAQLNILIQQTLNQAKLSISGLDAIAVSGGPGSYTGLRVGSSSAKGFCFGLNIPYIHIDTLAIIANRYKNTDYDAIIPMIDARRLEVYTALYSSELTQISEVKAFIIDEESMHHLLKPYSNPILCGNGAMKCKPFVDPSIEIIDSSLSARDMISLSHSKFEDQNFEDLAYYEPHYLKSPNITLSKKKIF